MMGEPLFESRPRNHSNPTREGKSRWVRSLPAPVDTPGMPPLFWLPGTKSARQSAVRPPSQRPLNMVLPEWGTKNSFIKHECDVLRLAMLSANNDFIEKSWHFCDTFSGTPVRRPLFEAYDHRHVHVIDATTFVAMLPCESLTLRSYISRFLSVHVGTHYRRRLDWALTLRQYAIMAIYDWGPPKRGRTRKVQHVQHGIRLLWSGPSTSWPLKSMTYIPYVDLTWKTSARTQPLQSRPRLSVSTLLPFLSAIFPTCLDPSSNRLVYYIISGPR